MTTREAQLESALCAAKAHIQSGSSQGYWLLDIIAAALSTPTTEPQAGYVVKPLVWTKELRKTWTAGDYIINDARNSDLYGGFIWGRVARGWSGPVATLELAQAAAQADYTARILAALEPQPYPRYEVIAKLVDALHAIELWDASRGYPIPYRHRDPMRAALAAAKAVQHD